MHLGLTMLAAVLNPKLVGAFANVLFQIRYRAPPIWSGILPVEA